MLQLIAQQAKDDNKVNAKTNYRIYGHHTNTGQVHTNTKKRR